MKKCYRLKVTNNMSNNDNEIYVSSVDDIMEIENSYICLYGYIDDCLFAKKDFKEIKGKEISYHAILPENVRIHGFKNLFDCLDVIKNDESICSLHFILSSKVSNANFQKLINYISNANHYFYIDFNLGNIEVFNNEQLEILNKINAENEDVDMFLNINQSNEGCHIENNDNDNTYEFDELMNIKQKVNKIISKVPSNYTDMEKVLFVYRYLGKKIKYDYSMVNIDYYKRKNRDKNSMYDVLFKNKGVCSGIATTLRIVLKVLGIECKVVSSVGHEWNVVKLNGKWYHLDLTWDLDNIKKDYPLEYFLKSESYILKDDSHQFYTWYADKDDIATRSITYSKYQK